MRTILPALSLMIAASAGPALAQDAAEVVAAERAFAADGRAEGITASFTRWSVPDAVVIAGGQARTVREVYPPDAPRPPDEPLLEWWPNFAGISRAGDLGFTTGGVAVNGERAGHYFTVWARQADGTWKWVYDGGSGVSAADVPGPDSDPDILPVAVEGEPAPDPDPVGARAMDAVRAAEADLAAAAAIDQKAAHLAVMADNGRLYVAPLAPAIGRAAFGPALDAWPGTFTFGPTAGGGVATSGDLAWTWGEAVWQRGDQLRQGHYVRVWQRQADGWRIVLAQLIPGPPLPALAVTPPAGG